MWTWNKPELKGNNILFLSWVCSKGTKIQESKCPRTEEQWQRKRKRRQYSKTEEKQREGSMLRLKYRHRVFLVCLILRGLVRCQLVMTATYLFWGCTVDDSVCYQWHSLIPIMVCTHCLLPWHQSRPCWASADDQTNRNDCKSHRGNYVYLWKRGFILHHPEQGDDDHSCPVFEGDCYQTQLNFVLRHSDAAF